jgi:dTDP-L-rhamnose 4-epimerase
MMAVCDGETEVAMAPEHVLVTGGAGFVGSFLADALVSRGHEVVVYDSLEPQVHVAARPAYLNAGVRYVWGDICHRPQLGPVVCRADVVVHLAALVGVGQSQYQVRRYAEANVLGTANLLDILANRRHRCRKLVVAGSMSSYGEGLYECAEHGRIRPTRVLPIMPAVDDWELRCPTCNQPAKALPIPESAALHPTSIYAVTKASQEALALAFGRAYDLPTVVLRFFNVYGPRQSLSNPYTGVAAIFLSRLKNGRRPLVYEDGRQTRDFVSVHDVVRAIVAAIEQPAADGEVFNVGTGRPVAIAQIAECLADTCHSPLRPRITLRFRKGDVRHCVADITKIRNRLGFQPHVGLADGLRELVNCSQSVWADDRFARAARELAVRRLA